MDEQIVVRVPDGTKARLEDVAGANDRTLSQEIRKLIREYLDRVETGGIR